MSSAGASILAVGYVLPLVLPALLAALRQAGRPEPLARDRPGMADAVAAAHGQFDETPVVVRGPYEYHLEKAQNEP